MRWIKPVIAIFSLGLLSCELGEVDLNNPLDTQANAEKGINPPALVFSPSSVNTSVGGNAIFRVFVQEVTGVAGIHAKIQYDNTKLTVESVSSGLFLIVLKHQYLFTKIMQVSSIFLLFIWEVIRLKMVRAMLHLSHLDLH